MKTKLFSAVAALALFAASGAAHAADATGDAAASIAVPISIAQNGAGLNFGTVTASAALGTVVVTTAGARSVTGGVAELGGTIAAATFDVTGEGTSAYTITLPSSATLNSGGNSMTVDTFNHDAGGSPALSGGSDSFNVGATLNVAANQAAGAYTGTYTITVNY